MLCLFYMPFLSYLWFLVCLNCFNYDYLFTTCPLVYIDYDYLFTTCLLVYHLPNVFSSVSYPLFPSLALSFVLRLFYLAYRVFYFFITFQYLTYTPFLTPLYRRCFLMALWFFHWCCFVGFRCVLCDLYYIDIYKLLIFYFIQVEFHMYILFFPLCIL